MRKSIWADRSQPIDVNTEENCTAGSKRSRRSEAAKSLKKINWFRNKGEEVMRKGVALVGGLGLGAALMYIFDPDRGKGRRARIRNKVDSAANKLGDAAEKMGRDISNRAQGVLAETKSIFRQEAVPDDVLVQRVRSRFGRLPVEIGGFEVLAHDGIVTLRGEIGDDDVPRVLRAARFVRGVKEVDNHLTVGSRQEGTPTISNQPQPLGA
jgi:osmotically-inducible protein OsmY